MFASTATELDTHLWGMEMERERRGGEGRRVNTNETDILQQPDRTKKKPQRFVILKFLLIF